VLLINIKPEEVLEAKEKIKEFDAQKTYNKFKCNNNFIGLLGEIVFDRYLTEQNIKHEWVGFIKKDYNQPDFRINNVSLDLGLPYLSLATSSDIRSILT